MVAAAAAAGKNALRQGVASQGRSGAIRARQIWAIRARRQWPCRPAGTCTVRRVRDMRRQCTGAAGTRHWRHARRAPWRTGSSFVRHTRAPSRLVGVGGFGSLSTTATGRSSRCGGLRFLVRKHHAGTRALRRQGAGGGAAPVCALCTGWGRGGRRRRCMLHSLATGWCRAATATRPAPPGIENRTG